MVVKLCLMVLVILLFLIGLLLVVGFLLPKKHVVAHAITLHQHPQVVFALISDFQGASSWRSELSAVKMLSPVSGKTRFLEITGPQSLPMEVAELHPPHRLVVRIVSDGLPFGGSWIYEVSPRDDGCQLTITEYGEIYHPVFRFLSRFVLGYTRTLDTYLKNVAHKFSEPASIKESSPGSL